MTTPTLPPWLTQGTFARCGTTLFQVVAVKRSDTDTLHLSDGLDLHLLTACKPATLADLTEATAFIDASGQACTLSYHDGLVTLDNGITRRYVRLPAEAAIVAEATRKFAAAFDGAIVEGWADAA